MTETITPPSVDVAARAIDASKIYGSGEAEVRALNGDQRASSRPVAAHARSWARRVRGSRRCCTAWPVSTGSRRVRSSSATSRSARPNEKELTLIRRDKLGFIFQAYNLIPTLNALENMTLPMSLAGNKPDPAWLDTIVETVRLKDRLTHRPAELSGGQQQRVAVGRALLSKPEIIFADEPTGNLDSRSGAEILTFMRKAVDELGQTIVMVTHDPIAASYADRVVFLADGAIVDELLERQRRHDPRQDEEPGRLSPCGRSRSRGSWRKKVRFLLTGIAVMLGVAFVSGTFVLTETISNTFNGLFNEIYQNTDAVVRAKEEFKAQGFGDAGRGTVSADLLSTVRNTEGVEAADGQVQGLAIIVDKQGDALGSDGQGAPTHRLRLRRRPRAEHPPRRGGPRSTRTRTRSSSTRAAPTTPATSVGDTVPVITKAGRNDYTLSGIVKFGSENSLLGATIAAFAPNAATRLLGTPGQFQSIDVKADSGRLAGPGGRQHPRFAEGRAGHPEHRGDQRRGHHCREPERPEGQPVVLQHVPADLRRRRAARRLLHHLQHVLDRRGPAQPGARAAARHRRRAAPGARARSCSRRCSSGSWRRPWASWPASSSPPGSRPSSGPWASTSRRATSRSLPPRSSGPTCSA